MMQAFKVKRGQRILLCNTIGAMGMEPMAIGAAIATGQRVIVTSGDGGFFMNMQELEVVKRLGLNIKYFVFMNGGYGSITTMQDARFGLRVASDKESGFSVPDLYRVASVWGIDYHEINCNAQLKRIKNILDTDRPAIVYVKSSLEFRYACKVEASLVDGQFVNDDLSNLTPYIDDYEEIMQC
jgi:acetolactate synthase-1/2/3 large subunit